MTYACSDTTAQKSSNNTIHYNASAYSFNITLSRNGDPESGLVQVLVQESYWSQKSQDIINICVFQQSFWGGWTQIGNSNSGISNRIYPQNLLPPLKPVSPSATTHQPSKAQDRTTLSAYSSLTPPLTILSEYLSRLVSAIENVVFNAEISLSAVATAVQNELV